MAALGENEAIFEAKATPDRFFKHGLPATGRSPPSRVTRNASNLPYPSSKKNKEPTYSLSHAGRNRRASVRSSSNGGRRMPRKKLRKQQAKYARYSSIHYYVDHASRL